MNICRPSLIFTISFVLIFPIVAQTKPSSAQELEKAGKLKEAAAAYFQSCLSNSGELALSDFTSALRVSSDSKVLISALSQIAEKHPETSLQLAALREMCDIYLANNDMGQGRNLARRILSLDPMAWKYRYISTAVSLYQGSLEQVRIELDESFRLNPPEPWFSKLVLVSALWLGQQNRYSEGLRLLEEQVLTKPTANSEAYLCAFLLARQGGANDKAILFQKSLKTRWPDSPASKTLDTSTGISISPVFLVLALGSAPQLEFNELNSPESKGNTSQNSVVQLGVFGVKINATKLIDRIKAKFPALKPEIIEGDGKYRVIQTVPKDRSNDEFLLELKEAGFEGFLDQ